MTRAFLPFLAVPLFVVAVAAGAPAAPQPDFDQGVDAKASLRAARDLARDPAMDKSLGESGAVSAASLNRCQAMGLEAGACLYVCRDGRRVRMPLPPGMEDMGSRACLQFIEAPAPVPPRASAAPAPVQPVRTCEEKCGDAYRRSADLCYELFDNPAGLRPCLQDAGMALHYCRQACAKPRAP